ncbi:MAG: MFS transporter, partial [Streptomyces sp.]|uniref:MFS transporter n=1 Tax=Streptomyces sp. TaxID=1931 RepID=UPI003D6A3907
RAPGLRVPLIATVVGALPLGMLGLGLLLYVNELTGSLTDAGMAAGAFGAGNALGVPLQGRLIDRFGQTAVVAPAGVVCGGWTILLVTTAPTVDSVVFAVAVSAGAGACVPATTGSMRVLLAELLEEGQVRAAGYALLAVLFQLALLTGPLATSALLAPAEPAGAVATGGILAAAAGLLFCGTKASRSWQPQRTPSTTGGIKGQRGLLVLLLIAGGVGISAGFVALAVPAAALARGNAADSGLLLAVVAAGEILGGLLFGARRWRWPSALMLLAALAGSAVAAGLVATAAGSLTLLYPTLFLTGVCGGPFAIACSSMLDTLAPRAALTSSYTLMVSVGLLGSSLGNGVGGAFVDAAGYRQLLTHNACWLFTLLTTALLLRRALATQPHPPAARTVPDASGTNDIRR